MVLCLLLTHPDLCKFASLTLEIKCELIFFSRPDGNVRGIIESSPVQAPNRPLPPPPVDAYPPSKPLPPIPKNQSPTSDGDDSPNDSTLVLRKVSLVDC